MALGDIDRHFAWQAWHLWHWTGFGGALGSPAVAAAVGVAGMALGDIDLDFAWQVWHLATSTFTLRGRCGTYGTGLALVTRFPFAAVVAVAVCVAGVALGDSR